MSVPRYILKRDNREDERSDERKRVNGLTKKQVIQMMEENDLGDFHERVKITIRNTKKHGAYWCVGVDEDIDTPEEFRYNIDEWRRIFGGTGVHLNVYREKYTLGGTRYVLTKYIL